MSILWYVIGLIVAFALGWKVALAFTALGIRTLRENGSVIIEKGPNWDASTSKGKPAPNAWGTHMGRPRPEE